ncbi:ATP-binding cassette domain-containing protein [Streptomyces sp. URMC 126]|uniref:ATP-binding cassette domain-containing protein n=1 Tax=Streptomyces sp. URMC 126 TaxID=3423401 RepID=UPI003F19D851
MPEPVRTPSVTRQGLRFLAARRATLARLAGWSVLEAGHTFALGYALARALDEGFLAGRAATGLGWLGLAALAVLAGAYGTGRTYRATADLVEPLRDGLVRRVVGRALVDGDAAAVSRLTHQVEIARDTFAGLVMVSRSFVFTAAGALAGLCALAPALLLAVVPPLLLGLLLFLATLRILARRQEAVLVADEALARSLDEVARGLRDITAGGAERRVAAATGALVDAERDAARALARWSLVRVAALTLAGRLPIVLLLTLAPWLLDRGVTPGAFVGALAYVTQSLLPAIQELVHGLGASGARLAVVVRRLTGGPTDAAGRPGGPGTGPGTGGTVPPATPDRAAAGRTAWTTRDVLARPSADGPPSASAMGTTDATVPVGPAEPTAAHRPSPAPRPTGPAPTATAAPHGADDRPAATPQGPSGRDRGHPPHADGTTTATPPPAPAADATPHHAGNRPPTDITRGPAAPQNPGHPPQGAQAAQTTRQDRGHSPHADGTTTATPPPKPTADAPPHRAGNRPWMAIPPGPAAPHDPGHSPQGAQAAQTTRQDRGNPPHADGPTTATPPPEPTAGATPHHAGNRPPTGIPRGPGAPHDPGRPPQVGQAKPDAVPGHTEGRPPTHPAREPAEPAARARRHRPEHPVPAAVGPAAPASRGRVPGNGADASRSPSRAASAAGVLEFRDVTFAYGPHAAPVVRDLNLRIAPGTRLAVVGPSGIGKSTLTGLAAGLLVPGRGEVAVGGMPARDAAARAARVLIPQEAYVFSGTLAENLGYLRPHPVPEDELWAAAEAVGMAGLAERIGGFRAPVAPAGLSAGERQWIALARAYLSPAPLALLDEATCHLDQAAEARAEDAFARRPGGTLVVVAHRAASALRADRILVMDGPHTVCGDHAELLRVSPLYRDLMAEAGPESSDGASGAGRSGPAPSGAGPSDPAGSLGDSYGVHPVPRAGLPGDRGHVVAHGPVRQVQTAGDLPDAGALGGE